MCKGPGGKGAHGQEPYLVFLGLVRRGDVSQVLDDLLGVLCLTSTGLSSVTQTESQRFEGENGREIKKTRKYKSRATVWMMSETHVHRMDWSSRSAEKRFDMVSAECTHRK